MKLKTVELPEKEINTAQELAYYLIATDGNLWPENSKVNISDELKKLIEKFLENYSKDVKGANLLIRASYLFPCDKLDKMVDTYVDTLMNNKELDVNLFINAVMHDKFLSNNILTRLLKYQKILLEKPVLKSEIKWFLPTHTKKEIGRVKRAKYDYAECVKKLSKWTEYANTFDTPDDLPGIIKDHIKKLEIELKAHQNRIERREKRLICFYEVEEIYIPNGMKTKNITF